MGTERGIVRTHVRIPRAQHVFIPEVLDGVLCTPKPTITDSKKKGANEKSCDVL